MKANLKKFKVIFVEQKKKDGTTFTKMLTILKKKDGTDLWAPIKFGDAVNTKVWKNKNQVVTAENKVMEDGSKNIRIPKSFDAYQYQGKTRYPYIYIQEIVSAEESKFTPKASDNYVDADEVEFSMDDEETTPVSANQIDDKDLPFN